ncbi:hypothetical protein KRR40_16425 [Niabella defluvii]|nr:hypothetical protein KRR40_16425 [Niabella sp. I65]
MKKILLPLALATATILALVSCKKNDNPAIPVGDDRASARMMQAFSKSMRHKQKHSILMLRQAALLL